MADDKDPDRLGSRSDMSRYDIVIGRDEIERAVRRQIEGMRLVTQDELSKAIEAAVSRANEDVVNRWANVGVAASFNSRMPGENERKIYRIFDKARGLLDYEEKAGKVWAWCVDQYDEQQARKGFWIRNAGAIAGLIAGIIACIGGLLALGGHR